MSEVTVPVEETNQPQPELTPAPAPETTTANPQPVEQIAQPTTTPPEQPQPATADQLTGQSASETSDAQTEPSPFDQLKAMGRTAAEEHYKTALTEAMQKHNLTPAGEDLQQLLDQANDPNNPVQQEMQETMKDFFIDQTLGDVDDATREQVKKMEFSSLQEMYRAQRESDLNRIDFLLEKLTDPEEIGIIETALQNVDMSDPEAVMMAIATAESQALGITQEEAIDKWEKQKKNWQSLSRAVQGALVSTLKLGATQSRMGSFIDLLLKEGGSYDASTFGHLKDMMDIPTDKEEVTEVQLREMLANPTKAGEALFKIYHGIKVKPDVESTPLKSVIGLNEELIEKASKGDVTALKESLKQLVEFFKKNDGTPQPAQAWLLFRQAFPYLMTQKETFILGKKGLNELEKWANSKTETAPKTQEQPVPSAPPLATAA